MSRNIETSIYSLDGNSIWDVALKFERLALQEMNRFPETVFQGQDLNDSRAAFNYKMQFDKLFSLIKEFYVKVNGVENLNVNEDVEDEFKREINEEKNKVSTKRAKKLFVKEVLGELNKLNIGGSVEKVRTRMDRILNGNDSGTVKYAKLEMILDALNEMFKYLEQNIEKMNFMEPLLTYEEENDETFYDVLKSVEGTYKENSEELKEEIVLSLKTNPELIRRSELRTTLRLSRYEGSSSNVLRDIMITSNSMILDINDKRVILQESIREDERIVNSIKNDNMLIVGYLKELVNMDEINKNYLEPFNKVVDNMGKINTFVKEL